MLYDARDALTGYNICEFVTLYGSIQLMEYLKRCFGSALNLGRALEFAIIKGKRDMLIYLLDSRNDFCVSGGKVVYISLKYDKEKMLDGLRHRIEKINVDDDIGNDNFNALHAFSAEGKLEAVEWLLRSQADPNRTGYCPSVGRRTALQIATEKGHFNIMKCLIEHKAYVNTKTKYDRVTSIQIACSKGNIEMIKYLIKHGANPTIKNSIGLNALEMLQKFVHANKIETSVYQETISLLAAQVEKHSNEISLKYKATLRNTYWSTNKHGLLKKHFFHTIQNSNFKQLVTACLESSTSDLWNFLRDPQEDSVFNLRNNASDLDTGFRPLDFAVVKGDLSVARCLLENGAQIEARDPWHITHNALDLAIKQGNEEMVKFLIQHGANVEHKLYLATKEGQIEIMKLLLKGDGFNKARIDALSENGFNALHLATKQNKIEIVKLFMKNGADPNMKSGREGHGRAAMHFAAESQNCEMIESFIDNFGADVLQKDTNGLTPLELAKRGIQTIIPDQQPQEKPNSKEDVIALLSSKMKLVQDTEIEKNFIINDPSSSKKRKVDHTESSVDDGQMVLPLINSFMNRSFPFEAKIGCLISINALISEKFDICHHLLKTEFVEEIANMADKIIFKVGSQQDKDLSMIAKILAKIFEFSEGKNLLDEVRLPPSTMERLKTEINCFQKKCNPEHFAFDSDHCRKVKTESEIKLE